MAEKISSSLLCISNISSQYPFQKHSKFHNFPIISSQAQISPHTEQILFSNDTHAGLCRTGCGAHEEQGVAALVQESSQVSPPLMGMSQPSQLPIRPSDANIMAGQYSFSGFHFSSPLSHEILPGVPEISKGPAFYHFRQYFRLLRHDAVILIFKVKCSGFPGFIQSFPRNWHIA